MRLLRRIIPLYFLLVPIVFLPNAMGFHNAWTRGDLSDDFNYGADLPTQKWDTQEEDTLRAVVDGQFLHMQNDDCNILTAGLGCGGHRVVEPLAEFRRTSFASSLIWRASMRVDANDKLFVPLGCVPGVDTSPPETREDDCEILRFELQTRRGAPLRDDDAIRVSFHHVDPLLLSNRLTIWVRTKDSSGTIHWNLLVNPFDDVKHDQWWTTEIYLKSTTVPTRIAEVKVTITNGARTFSMTVPSAMTDYVVSSPADPGIFGRWVARHNAKIDVDWAEFRWELPLDTSADLNADCRIDLLDVASISFYFGLSVPPADARADVNHDNRVDIVDVSIASAYFNQVC